MKKIYNSIVPFLLLFSFVPSSFGQNTIGCGTKLSQKEEATFRESLSKIANSKKTSKTKKAVTDTYIIPVVFHILADGSNIKRVFTKAEMKSRIDSAIDVCNKDFNGLYPGYNNVSPLFEGVKDKMNIKFVAATLDPDGNLLEIPGMNWHPEAGIVDGYDNSIYDYMYYGKNNKYYLDIVVVDEPNPGEGSTGSAHAFLPVQNTVPHVTYNHRYIGDGVGGSDSSFQFAKVISHEVGHYFGLRHTFEGNCDPVNDGMEDTPPTTSAFGCDLSAVNSCGVIANYENYMDYNTCQAMFTKDQCNAMTYWLDDMTVAKYPRGFLWQNDNLVSVGVIASMPVANFTVNTTATCTNKNITFKDISLGLPASRTWTFEGGTPATSTETNPTVTYAAPGTYAVTLTSTNALGNNTKTISGYIKIDQKITTNTTENFSGTFPPDGWLITNPDNNLAWGRNKDIGNGDKTCMIMNNANNKVIGELDYIQLPYYNFTNGINSQLYFDVAYAKYDDTYPDVLDVEVSTDCGANWVSVYSKTHTDLQTVSIDPLMEPNLWMPKTAENWRKEIVNLSSYIGNPNVTIRFKNKSGFGNYIWIDNVNVVISQSPTPISDFSTPVTRVNCSNIVIPFKDVSTGNPTTWAWLFPGGTPSSSTAQNPMVTYNTPGSYSVSLTTTNASGSGTTISKPNFITIATPVGTSFTEDFEGTFPPAGWEILNPDNKLTWEKRADVGHNSASCMIMNNAENKAKEIDEITLQPLNLAVGLTGFSFDVAYAKFDNDSPDVLEVLISKDCGVTWGTLYSKTHTVLETAISEDPNNWVPTLDSQWRTEIVSLDSYKGERNVLIKFKSISGFGSRIWIDNVKFTFDRKEKPYSDFKVTSARICSALPVQFSDISIGEPTSWSWSFPGGTPATSTSKNPSVIYNTVGSYDVTLVATNAYGQGTTMLKTNVVTLKEKNTLPVTEDFSGTFPTQDWEVLNLDNDAITWEQRKDAGKGDLSCLVINNADAKTGKIDELILKSMDFTTSDKPLFHFDLAYTQYLSTTDPTPAPDQIDILVSSDCGDTWTNVYSKNQLQLQTVSPPIIGADETNGWIPTKDSDWRNETVDLSIVKNQPNVLLKIKNTSGYGTRIWLDNFNITNDPSLGVGKKNSLEDIVTVYPNPSSGLFNITLPSSTEDYTVTISNMLGQVIYKDSFSDKKGSQRVLNLSNKEKGMYLLIIESSSKKTYIQKIIKF